MSEALIRAAGRTQERVVKRAARTTYGIAPISNAEAGAVILWNQPGFAGARWEKRGAATGRWVLHFVGSYKIKRSDPDPISWHCTLEGGGPRSKKPWRVVINKEL